MVARTGIREDDYLQAKCVGLLLVVCSRVIWYWLKSRLDSDYVRWPWGDDWSRLTILILVKVTSSKVETYLFPHWSLVGKKSASWSTIPCRLRFVQRSDQPGCKRSFTFAEAQRDKETERQDIFNIFRTCLWQLTHDGSDVGSSQARRLIRVETSDPLSLVTLYAVVTAIMRLLQRVWLFGPAAYRQGYVR